MNAEDAKKLEFMIREEVKHYQEAATQIQKLAEPSSQYMGQQSENKMVEKVSV